MYIIDQIKDNTLNIGIDGLVNTITQSKDSHKGAWPRIIQSMLQSQGYSHVHILNKDSKWDDYDAIIIDLGMEFQGTFNLFGGASDEVAMRLEQFYNYEGMLICYDNEFPSINEFVKSRYSAASDGFKILIDYDFNNKYVRNINSIYDSDKIILGDSHCISQYRPGWNINRNDGQTLYSFLQKDLSNYLYPGNIDELVLYFGNIDIRHHLCRQNNPSMATLALVNQYIEYVEDLLLEHPIKQITLVHTLPIENESRRVPKSGWYKGSAYYGSRDDRQLLVDIFNNRIDEVLQERHIIDDYSIIRYKHPKIYLNEHRELSFDVMEKPQSIHINPKFYPWNLDENIVNEFNHIKQNQEVLF